MSTASAGPAAEDRLAEAARVAMAREERSESPRGEWRDRLWFPVADERRECCEEIEPTPTNRQALEHHCRTQGHIARLFGIPLIDLRRAVKKARGGHTPGSAPARGQTPYEPNEGTREESIRELHGEARQLERLLPRLLAAKPADDDFLDLLAEAAEDLDRARFVVEYCLKLERALRTAQEVREMMMEIYERRKDRA